MKEIKLTQGFVAMVDDEDFEWLNQWKWHARKDDNGYYAGRSIYLGGGSKNQKIKTISMHRLIMNTPKGMETDHIDHNGLNNQRHNLRNATHSQNQYNRLPRGSSKYLGVTVLQNGKEKGRITAEIRCNGRRINLGRFKTEEEAARAYDLKAKEFYGEFANLNFK